MAIATCNRSDRCSFPDNSRRRHCASGRLRRCRTHASTTMFNTEPATAMTSIGMRMESLCRGTRGAAILVAANAASPMPTRMLFTVRTAVQRLCSRASVMLAPVTMPIPFELSNCPPVVRGRPGIAQAQIGYRTGLSIHEPDRQPYARSATSSISHKFLPTSSL